MIAALLALLTVAHAGEPSVVVFDSGDAASAVALIAQLTGDNPDSLVGRSAQEVFGTADATLTGGRARPCTGSSATAQTLAGQVARVENDLLFLDFSQATSDAELVDRLMACLSEPIDSERAGHAAFLSGVASFNAGATADARDSFRVAHQFHPGLQWDDAYGTAPEATFAAALADLATGGTAALDVTPGPATVPVFVDGRRITRRASVTAGRHLVQVGAADVTSLWVTLSPNATGRLVVPAAAGASAVQWVSDPARRADLSRLMAATLGRDQLAYVVSSGVPWQVTTGTDSWRALSPTRDPVSADPPVVQPGPSRAHDVPASLPPPAPPTARQRQRAWWLLPPGVGALSFGAGYGAHAFSQGRKAANTAELATTRASWDAASASYQRWSGRLTTAEIVAGVGAALTVAGATVKISGTTLVPDITRDRIVLHLAVPL